MEKIRVLLVDDDEDAYILIRRLLGRIAHKKMEVEWAKSYQAGVEKIAQPDHDIYLVDHRLGEKTGIDFLKEAQTRNLQCPIIILTGSSDPTIDWEAARTGAADFLLKDKLDPDTLERSIRYSMQHFATLRALQKSNERFRLLFERSRECIFISDDSGKLLEANEAAASLLEISREELLDHNLNDVLANGLAGNSAESGTGELVFAQADGDQRFAEFFAYKLGPNLNLSILRDITDRRRLEKAIEEVSEREQRRFGQDLHDGLGQTLTGICCLTKVLQQKLEAKKIPEGEDAAGLVKLITEALSQTRELARGLCPTALDQHDLQAALQQLSNNLERFFGVQSEVEADHAIKISDQTAATHLYRIAQEATTNSIKHGGATKIKISLAQKKNVVSLQVKDNGKGFKKAENTGMGLRVMQHRARMIGANIEINSSPGKGTTVTCSIEKRTGKNKKELVPEPLAA